MTNSPRPFQWTHQQPPFPTGLIDEFLSFWERVFHYSFYETKGILRGEESANNTDVLYVARDGQRLAATCHLTISQTDPRLGGVGEVAVPDEFRRLGLATTLCETARDDFFARGGEALFLGTENPQAQRIYERLGWQQLPGTTVMVCTQRPAAAKTFLEHWFQRRSRPCRIKVAGSDIRIPLIPLALIDHPWTILDVHADLLSSRQYVQHSCMGLYPRYEQLVSKGVVFAAWTEDNRLLGLASVKIDGPFASIDAFAYEFDQGNSLWKQLIRRGLQWVAEHPISECYCLVAVSDETKHSAFHSENFVDVGTGESLTIGEEVIKTRKMRYDLG